MVVFYRWYNRILIFCRLIPLNNWFVDTFKKKSCLIFTKSSYYVNMFSNSLLQIKNWLRKVKHLQIIVIRQWLRKIIILYKTYTTSCIIYFTHLSDWCVKIKKTFVMWQTVKKNLWGCGRTQYREKRYKSNSNHIVCLWRRRETKKDVLILNILILFVCFSVCLSPF